MPAELSYSGLADVGVRRGQSDGSRGSTDIPGTSSARSVRRCVSRWSSRGRLRVRTPPMQLAPLMVDRHVTDARRSVPSTPSLANFRRQRARLRQRRRPSLHQFVHRGWTVAQGGRSIRRPPNATSMTRSPHWTLAAISAAVVAGVIAATIFYYIEGNLPLLSRWIAPVEPSPSEAVREQNHDFGNSTRGPDSPSAQCEPFIVYAQNKWQPAGAKARLSPTANSRSIQRYGANEIIAVDGWVRADAPYPDNPPPFESDIWFHVAYDGGWVSFAAVRSAVTQQGDPYDPDGGPAASTPAECELAGSQ